MKNVLLIVVDQMRFDCIRKNGNNNIFTPNLDMLASKGVNFTNCYSAVPTCIAARASLMTGLKPENHLRVGYQDGVIWDYDKTMAREFTEYGYQTQAIGKMHVFPERNRVGFENVVLHDGYLHSNRKINSTNFKPYDYNDDYLEWLKDKGKNEYDLIDSGLGCNSWVCRTWPYEERLHPTNWTTKCAIDFLKKRDPMSPFFTMVSYVRPHSPLDPPRYFYDLYKDTEFDNNVSEWSQCNLNNSDTEALQIELDKDQLNNAKRGYYGLITHLDNQIGRLLMALEESGEASKTIVAFVSDHGDQLGEHNFFRKGLPYQGSVHVPFIVYDPTGSHCDDSSKLVELRDVFPTLFTLATNQEVYDIDGKNKFEEKNIDEYIHGEHVLGKFSNHYIVTNEWKYIWFDQTGKQQLFNLKLDPNEEMNVVDENQKVRESLKAVLMNELKNREEGFVKNGKLIANKSRVTTLSL